MLDSLVDVVAERLVPRRQKIIADNPILDFLRSRGVQLFAAGENFTTASCPAGLHKKSGHRPVSIDVSKQVWYCNDHKVGGSVIDWEAISKGITAAEAMQSLNGAAPESGKDTKKFVCAYDYTDEAGKLLFQSVRYKVPPPQNKTFLQRYPGPNGGWIWNTKGIRRVLYHLPQVIEADTVIVVEGEKDADLVTSLGLVATTNVGGAGKWRDEYAEVLKGKNVIVFGDIGDPDRNGEKHTETVLQSLFGKAKSLKHAIQPAHDIGEFILSLPESERRQAIQRLIDQAKPFVIRPDAERFEFSVLMSFDSSHDPNCLVGNRYLVRGGSSLWAGGSGYGKSALQLQLAVYWACGVPCFGLRPVRPLKSLIIQAENDLGDMGEQLQGVIAGIDAAGDLDVQARRELIEKNVGIYRAIGKSGPAFLNLLDALIEMDRPNFVWIDPLFAFAGCDLMNASATGRFIRDGLFPIAARRMVALNVVHHVGKPVRDPDAKKTGGGMAEIDFQYLGFGTSEIQNAFRAVNILVPVGDNGTFRLVLSKRGERAGAKDIDGNWCRSIYLQHSKQGICWLQCEKPEKKAKASANLKYTEQDILDEMSVVKGWAARALQAHMLNDCGMSEKTFYRLWKTLKKDGKIRLDSDENWIKC